MDLVISNGKTIGLMLICLLFGCVSDQQVKRDTATYNIIDHKPELGFNTSEATYLVSRSQVDNETIYEYLGVKDSFSISVKYDPDTVGTFINRYGSNKFEYEKSRDILYNGELIKVLKFGLNKGSIDGNKTIFYEPRIGLLIYRNDSWIHSKELRSSLGRDDLQLLVSIIKEDPIFYFDEIFRIPDPPQQEDIMN